MQENECRGVGERRSSSGDLRSCSPLRSAPLISRQRTPVRRAGSRRVSALSRVISEPPALSQTLKRLRAPRDFRDPQGRRSGILSRADPSKAGDGCGRTGLSPTTTYATTYGWVSAGIRRDLIAPPPSKMRLDGTKRDRTGLNRCTERLATNQKAAGSSPAERAT